MNDTSTIVQEYLNGQSLANLARANHCKPSDIKAILSQHKVHIRTRGEQNYFNPQNQRKYSINDSYFSTQSSNMAYLLGFLAADGCVYKNRNLIKIGLSAVDGDFLVKISEELDSTFPLHFYQTKDGFDVCEFKFSSYQIKQDLAQYGVVPNKTGSFNFPSKLESKYYLDFIRGYFDGDGSVSTAGSALRWQICAANPEILQSFVDILESYGVKPVKVQRDKRGLFCIQYSTNAVRQLFDIMYSPNCLCLTRKFIKYKTLLMK